MLSVYVICNISKLYVINLSDGDINMKISITAFKKLNISISDQPPESGGILGSTYDDVITEILKDKVEKTPNKMCCYEPNVYFLNQQIAKWTDKGISFKGIFHTHFVGVNTLSLADKKYIHKIMKNMPTHIKYLYFPIFVLPNRELVCYKAEKIKNRINIFPEDVTII